MHQSAIVLVRCVPGSSLLPPPYWKARRPWGRGCLEKSLNSVEVLEKYLISLSGLKTSLIFSTFLFLLLYFKWYCCPSDTTARVIPSDCYHFAKCCYDQLWLTKEKLQMTPLSVLASKRFKRGQRNRVSEEILDLENCKLSLKSP